MELQNDFAHVLSQKKYRMLLTRKQRVELLIDLLDSCEYYDSVYLGGPNEFRKIKDAIIAINNKEKLMNEYEIIQSSINIQSNTALVEKIKIIKKESDETT